MEEFRFSFIKSNCGAKKLMMRQNKRSNVKHSRKLKAFVESLSLEILIYYSKSFLTKYTLKLYVKLNAGKEIYCEDQFHFKSKQSYSSI